MMMNRRVVATKENESDWTRLIRRRCVNARGPQIEGRGGLLLSQSGELRAPYGPYPRLWPPAQKDQ